jgi:transcriptional regulator with XRE-family HTH domain
MATNDTEQPPPPHEAIVAANVRQLREAAGVSQAELAARITAAGTDFGEMAVWGIENNRRRIRVEDLYALGSALGVRPTSLLSRGAGPGDLFVVAFVGGGLVQVVADEYDLVEGWIRFHVQGRMVHMMPSHNVLDVRVRQDGGD